MDLMYVPTWIGQIEVLVEEPSIKAFLTRMCDFSRVISFDRRGAGLSDPMTTAPTLEDQMDDVLAVMDAAGCERAALMGSLEGGPLAMLFAATHPDRVAALVLYSTFARSRWAPDYDWAPPDEDCATSTWRGSWPSGARAPSRPALAPSKGDDPAFLEWAGRDGALRREPGHDRTDPRRGRQDRRAPRASDHPRPDAGHAPPRGHLPEGGARPLPGRAHPRRALRGARGQRQPLLRRRLRGDPRRDRGVPDRHPPRARARPGPGNGAVHGHRRVDRARRGDGRLGLAHAAGAPRSARANRRSSATAAER